MLISAYDIIINFDNIQKEDVFIKITKLLDNRVDNSSFIAYETNITNISDAFSDEFELDFEDIIKIKLLILLVESKNQLIQIY